MKAGQTNLEVGTKIILANIKGEDSYLNGLTGTVTHPFAFGCTNKGWIGIYLDKGQSCPYGDKLNIKATECKSIVGCQAKVSDGEIGTIIAYDANEQQGPAFFKNGVVTIRFERNGKNLLKRQGNYLEAYSSIKIIK